MLQSVELAGYLRPDTIAVPDPNDKVRHYINKNEPTLVSPVPADELSAGRPLRANAQREIMCGC
jgi:hypothetical protein